ncbi:NRDE family protein [Achromobacter deleyi]|uniref:NRDE family protein n=1 Tax=Achromobacter deleyi TaxID=1353891 RepID=UPI001490D84E|nr:NRDE family protein [Achromobacter deleyi]QVQ27901.1 NRDE family protein [Achromobacter deleyi]UIP23510.1 NRDE family protein [Achromobacter deleyi]
MCLAVLALHTLPGIPVLIAANRDEFHERPTLPAAQWADAPAICAGRDGQAGGTWMGVTVQGRYALVTNFREPGRHLDNAPSRGALVEDFLRGAMEPRAYLADVHRTDQAYNGFNLIVGDSREAWYLSNRNGGPRALAPGVYALSNHLLDTPWPKLARTKAAFTAVLQGRPQPDLPALYAALADRNPADDGDLPATGLPLDRERLLSSPFIVSPNYGTRSSSVLALHDDGAGQLDERRFAPDGAVSGESRLTFSWRAAGGGDILRTAPETIG